MRKISSVQFAVLFTVFALSTMTACSHQKVVTDPSATPTVTASATPTPSLPPVETAEPTTPSQDPAGTDSGIVPNEYYPAQLGEFRLANTPSYDERTADWVAEYRPISTAAGDVNISASFTQAEVPNQQEAVDSQIDSFAEMYEGANFTDYNGVKCAEGVSIGATSAAVVCMAGRPGFIMTTIGLSFSEVGSETPMIKDFAVAFSTHLASTLKQS